MSKNTPMVPIPVRIRDIKSMVLGPEMSKIIPPTILANTAQMFMAVVYTAWPLTASPLSMISFMNCTIPARKMENENSWKK